MKIFTLFWLAAITSVNALVPIAIKERAIDCNNGAVKILISVLSYYPSYASKLCSDILRRPPGPTTTVISSTTTTVISGSITSTIRSGMIATTTDSTLSLQTGEKYSCPYQPTLTVSFRLYSNDHEHERSFDCDHGHSHNPIHNFDCYYLCSP